MNHLDTATHPESHGSHAPHGHGVTGTRIGTVEPVGYQGRMTVGRKLKAYVALTKPRIIELLLVATVPTMFFAQQGVPNLWLVLNTLVGGTHSRPGPQARSTATSTATRTGSCAARPSGRS